MQANFFVKPIHVPKQVEHYTFWLLSTCDFPRLFRAVGRSENLGARRNAAGIIWPLVEIGLTGLPKTGGASDPPAPRLRQP